MMTTTREPAQEGRTAVQPLYGDEALTLFFGSNASGVATAMWATAMRDNYEDRIAQLQATIATLTGDLAQAQARIVQLEAQLAEAGQWEDVQYNDIINVDNGNQLRVVIGQGEKPSGNVHLHIRKRKDGKWTHVGVTTLLDDYRIQKRICEYIGSQSEANNEQ